VEIHWHFFERQPLVIIAVFCNNFNIFSTTAQVPESMADDSGSLAEHATL
jgi:hypothetical protein